ncbi:MAG TPA: tRNA lysidine(34) synthetase TilS [Chloroflexota bacterium]|nr:tRNA lysidine(34) synthetase TilS [Chloroflexota bacterium]
MASAAATVHEALLATRGRMPDLLERGTRLVVAFSGGQDSTCLLHALHTLQPDLQLLAAHVDHSLRAESAAAAQRAVELAERIGVRASVMRVDVAAYRKQRSIQHAARVARYQALAAMVREQSAQALLVAHTADDQAETVLLNLVRGTGLRGVAAMRVDETIDPRQLGPPLPGLTVPTTLRVARPLLGIERATTLAYCAEIGLPIVDDASNQSRVYTRNRVRLDLLPLLERFNPAIRTVLGRTAELAAEDDAALDQIVLGLHSQLARLAGLHTLAYPLQAFRAQPYALQRRLLRHGLGCVVGTLVDVPAAPIEDALAVVRSAQPGRAYHLPYGVELVISADAFELRRFGTARRRPSPSDRGDVGEGETIANNRGSDAPRV